MIALPATLLLPAWRRCVPDEALLRIPTPLEMRLDAGEWALLLGRFSGSDGANSRRLVVDDVYGAVKGFASQTGIDFTSMLPPRRELIHALETASVVTSHTFEGKPFRNRYVVLDLRDRCGLLILLSNGSGHLLDDEGNQPFVVETARLMRKYRPAVLVCKRFDRLAREDWGAAPIMVALRQLDCFLSDEDGLGDFDFARSLTSFVKGGGSRRQADQLPVQSRDGQRNMSGTELIDGRVAYHISSMPPPGCGVVWLKGTGTTPTDRVLYLDAPGCRPAAAQVASGLPGLFDDDGVPIDQVGNIRHFLAHYGRPSWPASRLVGELADRGFSTEGMRTHNNDVTAAIRTDGAGNSALATILAHLEDYEREELHIQVGAADEPYIITGFKPPDGQPWATARDFKRIRQHLRSRDERLEKAAWLTFSGLRARFNGEPVRMLVNRKGRGASTARSYRFVLEEHYPQLSTSPVPRLLLPPEAWAQSIVDGLSAMEGQALLPGQLPDLDTGSDDGSGRLRGELATLKSQVDASEVRLDTLQERLEQKDADGNFILTGAMLLNVQTEYNKLAEEDLPVWRQRHADLEIRAEELEAHRSKGADVSGLLRLVESLRDPEDRRFRPVWLTAVCNVSFTTIASPAGMTGWLLEWAGGIEFATPDGTSVLIPFRGSHDTRRRRGEQPAETVRSNVERCLDAMREGVPFADIELPYRMRLLPALRAKLGAAPDQLLRVFSCDDPFLVRTTIECLLRADEPPEDLADSIELPTSLIKRIYATQAAPGRGWLLEGDASEVALYALAAKNGGAVMAEEAAELAGTSIGQVYNTASRLRRDTDLWSTQRKRGYILAPCDCGSIARAPMRLREVDGPVCLGCRQDQAEIVWAVDPYDRYRAHAQLWLVARSTLARRRAAESTARRHRSQLHLDRGQ